MINKMNTSLIAPFLLVLVVFFSNTKMVYAVDPVFSSASNCVSTGAEITSHVLGSIKNRASTHFLSVFCPVSWDHAGSIDGGIVRIQDSNPTHNFSCTLLSVYMNNSGSLSFVHQTRRSTSVGIKTLVFSSMSELHSKAHATIHCLIPPYHSTNGASILSTYSFDP